MMTYFFTVRGFGHPVFLKPHFGHPVMKILAKTLLLPTNSKCHLCPNIKIPFMAAGVNIFMHGDVYQTRELSGKFPKEKC